MFLKYAVNSMIVPQFYCAGPDCPTLVVFTSAGTTTTSTTSDYVQDFLGMEYSDRWPALLALVGFACACWLFFLVASSAGSLVRR